MAIPGVPGTRAALADAVQAQIVRIGVQRGGNQATNPLTLVRALKALSIRDRLQHISIPLLAINGDHDTLLSIRDTVELAQGATRGTLPHYSDDDHCAMRHYRLWLDHSQHWLTNTSCGPTVPRTGLRTPSASDTQSWPHRRAHALDGRTSVIGQATSVFH